MSIEAVRMQGEDLPALPKRSQEAKCPKCFKRGGVVARHVAFADHRVVVQAGRRSAERLYRATAITSDTDSYECRECNAELSKAEIERVNGVLL